MRWWPWAIAATPTFFQRSGGWRTTKTPWSRSTRDGLRAKSKSRLRRCKPSKKRRARMFPQNATDGGQTHDDDGEENFLAAGGFRIRTHNDSAGKESSRGNRAGGQGLEPQ